MEGFRNSSDFAVLEALLNLGPQEVNRLGRKVLLTSGSISTAIDRLVALGQVERVAHSSDGRKVVVNLTESGQRRIEKAFPRHADRLEEIFNVLEADDRRMLIKLLEKLRKRATQHEFSQRPSAESFKAVR
ncbi:MAG: MarR family winged helix-turn-helix transcriptional regulator [Puniceicoccaceae bacterium]